MKKKETIQTREEVFKEQASSYTVCFIERCPLKERCLRWLVGQYVNPTPFVCTSVNPRNPKVGSEPCEMFRDAERKVMKRGFRRLFDDMPARVAYSIRHTLIAWWGRKRYFEMRRGERLITPEQQKDIEDACRQFGWTGLIVYDGEQEDWLW